MLNEVLRLTQGDLSNVIKEDDDKPIPQDQENGQTERNNKAFYKDYQGENHV
jgi:hypothetical protein